MVFFSEWSLALCSGAVAGLSVDLFLYPIDTLKTRLQSKEGLLKSGGFRRLYAGIGSIAVGSAPGAALFFTAYESTRKYLLKSSDSRASQVVCDMVGASVGEIAACAVRVPVEVIKQRAQVSANLSTAQVFSKSVKEEGLLVLFRGYKITVFREVPFSFIQFPLWEMLKQQMAKRNGSMEPTCFQSALCGFIAGGVSAGLTTPLDVVKTRIMLASKNDNVSSGLIIPVMTDVVKKEGMSALFSGLLPRVTWISVGGFIFLGMYDAVRSLFSSIA